MVHALIVMQRNSEGNVVTNTTTNVSTDRGGQDAR